MNSKSDKTLIAAQRLIDAKFYTQSVHCSYYAVLQLMKYKLANTSDSPLSYDRQSALMVGRSSHEVLLREVKSRINNPRNRMRFGQDFEYLKSERVDADYTLKQFDDIESLECKAQAERLISNLNTYFNIA